MLSFKILLLCAFLLFIGTGLYTLFPGASYIFIICMCMLLYFDNLFRKNPFKYLEPNMIMGIFIFNFFLLMQIFFSQLGTQDYYNKISAVSVMILTYVYVKIIIDKGQTTYKIVNRSFSILLLLGLCVLLISQIAQINGYIKQVNYEGAESNVLITLARPGGFLNPNVTAAVAVIFIFMIDRLSKVTGKLIFMMALPIAITVISLTQSRMALISLVGFLIIILSKNSLRKMLPVLLMIFVLFFFVRLAYPDVLVDLLDNLVQRFEGDASTDERQYALLYSFEAFADSPLFGNGSTYLVSKLGVSSHNQIVEILVSYGLVGLLVMSIAFNFLYLPCAALLFVFCIMPMLILSHNFFDSMPYQLVLGMALALDQHFGFDVSAAPTGRNISLRT